VQPLEDEINDILISRQSNPGFKNNEGKDFTMLFKKEESRDSTPKNHLSSHPKIVLRKNK
jgi:hypothetical protein